MAKYHISEQYFDAVQKKQEAIISRKNAGMVGVDGECPYCHRHQGTMYRPNKQIGITAVFQTKCEKCGNIIYIPISMRTVSFRAVRAF